MNPQESNRLVIIHDTDADGIAAAWAVNKQYSGKNIATPNQPPKTFSETVYLPQRAGNNDLPNFEFHTTDVVYLVDRSYPWKMLKHLSLYVNSVTVIDHHKSALEEYRKVYYTASVDTQVMDINLVSASVDSINFSAGSINIFINTTRSACTLAWNVCADVMKDQAEPIQPWFIPYIEDRDLWRFNLPKSKEINAGMHLRGFTFENMDLWYKCDEEANSWSGLGRDYIDNLADIGSIVLQTQLNIIKGLAHGNTVDYGTVERCFYFTRPEDPTVLKIAILCCPYTLISDLGNYMLHHEEEGYVQPDVVMCYNIIADQAKPPYTYSLRSKLDVLWIAKLFHGGGHPNACGFSCEHEPDDVCQMIQAHLHSVFGYDATPCIEKN